MDRLRASLALTCGGGSRNPFSSWLAHRFVFTPVWALPWGENGKGMVSQIVRGQVSWIFQAQSGRPITARESRNISLTNQDADRPNLIFGCNPNNDPKTVNEWMNTSGFTLPPTGTFGDVGRSSDPAW
jgi:hypothetical protein